MSLWRKGDRKGVKHKKHLSCFSFTKLDVTNKLTVTKLSEKVRAVKNRLQDVFRTTVEF